MSLLCTVILGLYCIAAPLGDTTIKIGNAGLGATAAVDVQSLKGGPWRADLTLFTNVPEHFDHSVAGRACEGDDCVFYLRHCNDAAHPTLCRYTIDSADEIRSMTIEAPTEAGLRLAMDTLGIVVAMHGENGHGG